MKVLLLILGGAIGTGLRFGISSWVQKTLLFSFPFGILSVNLLGSFFIGFSWSLAEAFHFSILTRAFLFTGLFGGFTTFSSFALDSAFLFQTGAYKVALLNIFGNNLLGLLAVFLGIETGKKLLVLFA